MWVSIMSTYILLSRNRPASRGHAVLMALALVFAAPVSPAMAQAVEATGTPVFTVIVTRHGVRSTKDDQNGSKPHRYAWPKWEVGPNNLTRHGYKLMTLMGKFYRDKQAMEHLPVDCPKDTVFVYADTDQRTLRTARALIEGLCEGDPKGPRALTVYHVKVAKPPKKPEDTKIKDPDPIFNATAWVAKHSGIKRDESEEAVRNAAGGSQGSSFPIVTKHADDFNAFQLLLNRRCNDGGCKPIMEAPQPWLKDPPPGTLAALKGPLELGQSYSESIFLEYAECRKLEEMAPGLHEKVEKDEKQFLVDLQAGMRLHVLSYVVNARNEYNPRVRGGTLFAHIVAMLNQKAGLTSELHVTTPAQLKGTTLAILSGHDTQLGALGGILSADWNPEEGGIALDDMPPGSALIFDLLKPAAPGAPYTVRLRFASMTMPQFTHEEAIPGGIKLYPVTLAGVLYSDCFASECAVPLEMLDARAVKLRSLVDPDWAPDRAPVKGDGSSSGLDDPIWSQCRARHDQR
jgi:hypothetical protein